MINYIQTKNRILNYLTIFQTWSQSYQTHFGVIKSFFWRKLRQLSMHKFERWNLCQNLCQKTSFCLVLSCKSCFIGLKNVFFVITPTPKFWRWRNYFYRIGWKPLSPFPLPCVHPWPSLLELPWNCLFPSLTLKASKLRLK